MILVSIDWHHQGSVGNYTCVHGHWESHSMYKVNVVGNFKLGVRLGKGIFPECACFVIMAVAGGVGQ
jgi:hypothetical protein